MSRLTVGSLEGLSENSNVISVPTGHTLNVADAGALQIGGSGVVSAGLVHISRTTIGSNVTSITVSNVFSADYDNYRIMVGGGQVAFDVVYWMYMLGSTGYDYKQQYRAAYNTSIVSTSRTTDPAWTVVPFGSDAGSTCIDIFNPYVSTARTTIIHSGFHDGGTWIIGAGWHNVTASYNGFVLYDTGGQTAVTGGTIDVYGYVKS